MKVLLLAPEPFYQERGTPIAVRLLVEALSRRGWGIDLLTYAEGADVSFPHVRLFRIARVPGLRNIRPGLSFKKLICDVLLLIGAIRMARREHYDYVHCVEESVFVGLWLRLITGTPYVYDMDSSLSQQVLAKCRLLTPLAPLMRALEGVTIRRAAVVIPVCDALADVARRSGAKNVIVLNDVSLLGRESLRDGSAAKAALGIQETCFMYIGNLERYQGIDLLLRSFARAVQGGIAAVLIVVGGTLSDIAEYEARSRRLHIAAKVHFCGEAPVEQIGRLITAADVLVSPRLKGSNTPMKIYTYMDSGKAILATAIPAHTQVLASDAALLEPPEVEAFAEGMRQLASDAQLRVQLGARAKALAHDRYSREAFERRVAELCVALESPITHEASGITPRAA